MEKSWQGFFENAFHLILVHEKNHDDFFFMEKSWWPGRPRSNYFVVRGLETIMLEDFVSGKVVP